MNGLASIRFALSECAEKGVHDVLGRKEGVASTGVLYDPRKTAKRGGWMPYDVLDIEQPFTLEITKTHILIRTHANKVWWTIAHENRSLVVGFNYMRFQIRPFAPQPKSPVGLLFS